MGKDIGDLSAEEIRKLIDELPIGYISVKTIRGAKRYYHQWYENGKTQTKYIRAEDYPELKEKIDLRIELKKRLTELKADTEPFRTDVIAGPDLWKKAKVAEGTVKRNCFDRIVRYMNGEDEQKVCMIYGLRRTGKTMLICQTLASMTPEQLGRTAVLTATSGNSMYDLRGDLYRLLRQGYRYLFIDEVTKLREFIDQSSYFSDLVSNDTELRIVLSGTDSLGLWAASRNDLYGRSIMIHTTWIPYKEHSGVLRIDDIDDYIRMGGLLRHGETSLSEPGLFIDEMPFDSYEETEDYVGVAISKNIENTIGKYSRSNGYRSLYKFHMVNEFTGLVNRIVEDMNHRFVLEVLERDFHSHDFDNVFHNLERMDLQVVSEPYEDIDREMILGILKERLEIKDHGERDMEPTEDDVRYLREYLFALDVFARLPAVSLGGPDVSEFTLCIQPGLRYFQAIALVDAMMMDDRIRSLDAEERRRISRMVRDTVKGQILEEIVINDTMRFIGRGYRVFKLFLSGGEVDMVIQKRSTGECVLVEVKHAIKRNDAQFRHLVSKDTCGTVESDIGPIAGKYVLYRGEDADARRGVRYLNVENYLKDLPDSARNLFGEE